MHDTPVIDYIVTHDNSDCALKKTLNFAVDSYGIGFPNNEKSELKVSNMSLSLQGIVCLTR